MREFLAELGQLWGVFDRTRAGFGPASTEIGRVRQVGPTWTTLDRESLTAFSGPRCQCSIAAHSDLMGAGKFRRPHGHWGSHKVSGNLWVAVPSGLLRHHGLPGSHDTMGCGTPCMAAIVAHEFLRTDFAKAALHCPARRFVAATEGHHPTRVHALIW